MTLSPEQQSNASQRATWPIYIVELEHSGVAELLSTTSEIVYNGRTFTPSDVEIVDIKDTTDATLTLARTAQRMVELQRGQYRYGICKIWYIPALDGDSPEFEEAKGKLVFSGKLTASLLQGERIQLRAVHRNNVSSYSPRHTLDEITPFAAAPGTQITWEGEIYTLEAAR